MHKTRNPDREANQANQITVLMAKLADLTKKNTVMHHKNNSLKETVAALRARLRELEGQVEGRLAELETERLATLNALDEDRRVRDLRRELDRRNRVIAELCSRYGESVSL